jgi:hypothetical protein
MNIDDIKAELKKLLDSQSSINTPEFDDALNKIMEKKNNAPNKDFEGYSPIDMYQILNFLFEEKCPIRIKKMSQKDTEKIPIYNGVKFLVDYLVSNEKIKLTSTGNLPTKIVSELYNKKYFLEESIENGIVNLRSENDSNYIHLCHIILTHISYAKKVKGILTLTSKGKKNAFNHQQFIEDILKFYCIKFNWDYLDSYKNFEVAKLGNGFSIYLLSKYGNVMREDYYYASKYFQAFPIISENINVKSFFQSKEEYLTNCFSMRTFKKFGQFFGLVKLDNKNRFSVPSMVQKTELLDLMFEIDKPVKY